jgi:hypothetical protein
MEFFDENFRSFRNSTENFHNFELCLAFSKCMEKDSRLISIGQKQLQIFRQKMVGSDILLYTCKRNYILTDILQTFWCKISHNLMNGLCVLLTSVRN